MSSVALGVAAGTAVIAGALLVGDSMRGSLRDLTLQRLGSIGFAIIPGSFFNESLVDRWVKNNNTASTVPPVTAAPVLLFTEAVLETSGTEPVRRVGTVQAVGCDQRFWQFAGVDERPKLEGADEESVVLNATAAEQLQVRVGDTVTVRLPTEQAVPADNPLGRRDQGTTGLPNLKVVAILPEHGFGRFALRPSQQPTASVFLPLKLVQDTLDRAGQVNSVFIATEDRGADDPTTAQRWAEQWTANLPLGLEDYGLRLKQVQRDYTNNEQSEAIFQYWSLSSERLILSPELTNRLLQDIGPERCQPVMTYLANSLEKVPADPKAAESKAADGEVTEVAYSMITGISDGPGLALIENAEGLNTDDAAAFLGATNSTIQTPIILNSWTADHLTVKVGDPLKVTYFHPETVGGREVEESFTGVVAGIVPVTAPSKPYSRRSVAQFDQPPTRFNDPDFTPEVPGVTDQDSILDWDLPFKLQRKVTTEDDRYWNSYRLTPKAFIPYQVAAEKFGSRFGKATSLMIDGSLPEADLRKTIERSLNNIRGDLGWGVLPLRAQQLAASRGATPFDALFLSLSMFIIIAAMLLVVLLLRLAIEYRAAEFGTLLATGWTGPRVTKLVFAESSATVVLGSVLGVVLGTIYAGIVVYLLRTWWVGAVAAPFLELHITPRSLALGAIIGMVLGALTVYWTLRRLSKIPPRTLLGGRVEAEGSAQNRGRRRVTLAVVAFGLLGGAATGLLATRLQGQAQGGAFVGGGMLLLVGLLGSYRLWLSRYVADRPIGFGLIQLAGRNSRRKPLRSVLTASLIAVAGFMILAMGAFRLDPSNSGAGGFDLLATTSQPIYRDLQASDVRQELLGNDAKKLDGAEVLMVRQRVGQDASCNNLYQATQPQVLGLPTRIAELQASAQESGGNAAFVFAAGDQQKSWDDLQTAANGTRDDPIPVIIDLNTAMWSLQMRGGLGEVRSFQYDNDEPIYFKVVGLLNNSVLQGSLIVSEANFVKVFPRVTGYRQMLIRSGSADPKAISDVLENRLGDAGVDVQPTFQLLARLLEVQNTYLRTFQGLGALGLLLGTFGLAAAQLRSVLERRGELALMRAVGFTETRLSRLILIEAAQLLCGGLLVAAVAAAAALVPYAVLGRAKIGWQEPLLLLSVVLVVGLCVSGWAASRAIRAPLLAALRGN